MSRTPDRASPGPENNRARSNKKKRKSSGIFSAIGTLLASLFLICVITGCIVVSVLTVYILRYIGSDNDVNLSQIQLSYTTIFYAVDNNTGEYYEYQRLHGDENRIWVDLNQMPEHLINATIAGEDARFRTHQGVDWKRTFGAFINEFIPIYSGRQGGSTITQQLIKNATKDDAVRVDRKVREIFRALNMEKHYSKDEIIETYLNTLSLGNNTAGVQAAANLYFDKDVSEITLVEAAAMIAITKYPTYYDPFINPDNNKVRRNYILGEMLELGFITQEEYDEAVETELVLNTGAKKKLNADYNWFTDHVIEEVLDDLVEEKGYTRNYAWQQLSRGGYRIYTTMDEEMQNYLEDFYADVSKFPAVKNEEYPQSAFVITDLNGKILALVGERGEKTLNRAFNRATQAKRQPGSTIKPISSYALSIENDLINWSTIIDDEEVVISQPGQPDWKPKNYYNDFKGPITVDEAIQRSTNIIPVKLTQMLTPKVMYSFLAERLGLHSLTASDISYSPMALGSLTEGVTPLEMAGAYQIIGNGGTYTPPYAYTKVLDSEGNVVLEKDTTPIRVISYETSTVLNRLLQRVTKGPYGTGTRAPFRNDIPVAGKTGTSDKDYNQWFIGMTPYYLGVCWMGYDQPDTIRYSVYPPPLLWKSVMSGIHDGLPAKDFQYSTKVVSKTYCTISGLLATDSCTSTGTGWYKASSLPGPCTVCEGVIESEDLGGWGRWRNRFDDDD